MVLLRRRIAPQDEAPLAKLPVTPRRRLARRGVALERKRERRREPPFGVVRLAVEKGEASEPHLEVEPALAPPFHEPRHPTEGGGGAMIVAELEQRVTQDLEGEARAGIELPEPAAVLAGAGEVVRCQLHLGEHGEPAGVSFGRKSGERGARRTAGEIEVRDAAVLPHPLQVVAGKLVVRDEVLGVVLDATLEIADRGLVDVAGGGHGRSPAHLLRGALPVAAAARNRGNERHDDDPDADRPEGRTLGRLPATRFSCAYGRPWSRAGTAAGGGLLDDEKDLSRPAVEEIDG